MVPVEIVRECKIFKMFPENLLPSTNPATYDKLHYVTEMRKP